MKKILITSIYICMMTIHISAQGQGGASIYAGITEATSPDALLTPEGTSITGYHVGLDARLFSGTMYFGGGIEYHQLTLLALPEAEYFSPTKSMAVIKTRAGLGFNLHQFSYRTLLRAKVYGTFNFNSTYDKDMIPNPDEYIYNGAYAGLIGGVGMDLAFITIDVEYEKGMVNALQGRPDSKLDFWKASIGFFF